jgi:CheY-like chemotaxis protein
MTGMTVEQYDSGEEFLDAASTSPADCVVLDVQLGDLSGIAVAQRLQEIEPQFPIVFITGSIDPVFEQQADEIAGAAFLRKPFLPKKLLKTIEEVLETPQSQRTIASLIDPGPQSPEQVRSLLERLDRAGAPPPQPKGRLICVVPGKPGCGASTLATHLAVACSASGEGKAENIGESWRIAGLLGEKGIPNRVDSWGPDWPHDWPTWRTMLPQYLDELTR